MHAVEAERRRIEALVAQSLGQMANMPRQQAGDMRSAGFEADIICLPQDIIAPLQDADGNFYFMPDFDGADGASPIL